MARRKRQQGEDEGCEREGGGTYTAESAVFGVSRARHLDQTLSIVDGRSVIIGNVKMRRG